MVCRARHCGCSASRRKCLSHPLESRHRPFEASVLKGDEVSRTNSRVVFEEGRCIQTSRTSRANSSFALSGTIPSAFVLDQFLVAEKGLKSHRMHHSLPPCCRNSLFKSCPTLSPRPVPATRSYVRSECTGSCPNQTMVL